ncbi:hypothetical protein [Flavobacterium magnum]|uniref:hypothetical protein n=1 Tax=Flavobacterium magnum TaxID=2162713 RepID=UPI0011B20EB2|nr:hypothetical protein [Flavobacterium magnum]
MGKTKDMKKALPFLAILIVFACTESKYAKQEQAVREQMKKLDGAAAYADKAQIAITETNPQQVYGILYRKADRMISNITPCVSADCQYELHRYTEKKKTYQALMAAGTKKVFYQAHVFVLEGKDTLVSSYMFFDDADNFIDFTPKLNP